MENNKNKALVTFNQYADLTNIKDSMQFASGTTIATLKTQKHALDLEVCGCVKVFFDERLTGDPDCYTSPSEFPKALRDIISGEKEIYRADGDIKGIEHAWSLDDRVDVCENNWFEIFCDDSISYVVDAEGLSTGEVLDMLLDYEKSIEEMEE